MDFTVFTEKGEFTFEEEREGMKKNTLESYEKSLNKKLIKVILLSPLM